MNLSLLIDRWEKARQTLPPCCLDTLDKCISDLKMVISGELRQGYSLDSVCHMKKHLGKSWQLVIEQDPSYVDWCLSNLSWFQLDEIAHAYLVERQTTYE